MRSLHSSKSRWHPARDVLWRCKALFQFFDNNVPSWDTISLRLFTTIKRQLTGKMMQGNKFCWEITSARLGGQNERCEWNIAWAWDQTDDSRSVSATSAKPDSVLASPAKEQEEGQGLRGWFGQGNFSDALKRRLAFSHFLVCFLLLPVTSLFYNCPELLWYVKIAWI